MNLERDISERMLAAEMVALPGRAIPTAMVQKNFRLPYDLAQKLKLHVAQQSVSTGSRITETDIVEALLRGYLNQGVRPA